MRKILMLFGFISLALGIIGAFLPLLPTTPFVLLSAYLFAKSSTRMHNWIMNHRLFGQIIRDYNEDKSISLRIKVIAIGSMCISIGITMFTVASNKLWLQAILFITALAVSIHISRYKTKKSNQP